MLKRSKKTNSKTKALKALKVGRLKTVLGWREWASLPDLHIPEIKVKIDTGARSSALHAYDLVVTRKLGREFVRFKVHPLQRNKRKVVDCEAPLLEWRQVTDSGGKRTLRPVIKTRLRIAGREVMAEVTLIARDEMGFRMLVGRQAMRNAWFVDPSKSYVSERQILVTGIQKNNIRSGEEE